MLTSVATDWPGSEAPPRRYRTVFISDVHLGTRGCKADCLLDFLRHVESDYLYLVGDIVDGWRLQKRWFWPDKHAEVLERLLARARDGTEVVYLPGNHDEALRKLIGRSVGGVKIRHDAIHRTADGRRLLVVHGDVFDGVVADMRWLALVGSVAYELASTANTWLNIARRWLGLGLLAALRLPQGAGQGGGQVHRPVRALARRRGAAAQRVRRDLRPCPQARDANHRRRPLLQRWRLGRELLGAGRARRRPPRAAALGAAAPARPARAAPAGRRGQRRAKALIAA